MALLGCRHLRSLCDSRHVPILPLSLKLPWCWRRHGSWTLKRPLLGWMYRDPTLLKGRAEKSRCLSPMETLPKYKAIFGSCREYSRKTLMTISSHWLQAKSGCSLGREKKPNSVYEATRSSKTKSGKSWQEGKLQMGTTGKPLVSSWEWGSPAHKQHWFWSSTV